MFKPSAWVIAGAAVLATAGVAHAQERPAPVAGASQADTTRSAVPWYQRFTTSNGVTESITGDSENDRLPPPAWTLNQRWGVTLDVREAQRIERSPDGGRGDQTSVGAFYQFTPNVRVGGEVSVELSERPGASPVLREDDEPRAGVRIESAFRF
ncbi:MAG: NtrZ family periplasmic regulatory protein [Hyphomonadaceae bacterium]